MATTTAATTTIVKTAVQTSGQAKDLAAKRMSLPRMNRLTENNVVEYCKMFGLDAFC